MIQEDKELLLKDLCARLPYKVKVKVVNEDILLYNYEVGFIIGKESINDECFIIQCSNDDYILSYDEFKPYLLPLSSMTEEQEKEYNDLNCYELGCFPHTEAALDYLIENQFDFRGLIPKGLAIDATGLNIY